MKFNLRMRAAKATGGPTLRSSLPWMRILITALQRKMILTIAACDRVLPECFIADETTASPPRLMPDPP